VLGNLSFKPRKEMDASRPAAAGRLSPYASLRLVFGISMYLSRSGRSDSFRVG